MWRWCLRFFVAPAVPARMVHPVSGADCQMVFIAAIRAEDVLRAFDVEFFERQALVLRPGRGGSSVCGEAVSLGCSSSPERGVWSGCPAM